MWAWASFGGRRPTIGLDRGAAVDRTAVLRIQHALLGGHQLKETLLFSDGRTSAKRAD